jgi:hypothetical protein
MTKRRPATIGEILVEEFMRPMALNAQRRGDLWKAMNSPRERERIERGTVGALAGSYPVWNVRRIVHNGEHHGRHRCAVCDPIPADV